MKNKSISHIQAYAVLVGTNIILINKPLYRILTYFCKNKDILDIINAYNLSTWTIYDQFSLLFHTGWE